MPEAGRTRFEAAAPDRAPLAPLDRAAFDAALAEAADILRRAGPRLETLGRARRALVYSFGVRGRDLALQLRALGVECVVFDRAASARDQAAAMGFETSCGLDSSLPIIVAAGQNQVEVLDALELEAFSLAEGLYAFDLRTSYGRARAFSDYVADHHEGLFAQYLAIDADCRADFLDVLLYRASLDVRRTDSTRLPLADMWRPPAAITGIASFCDVGAYDGDTLSAVKAVYPGLERTFTIEPNPALSASIAETARRHGLSNTHYVGGAWRRAARLSTVQQHNGMLAITEDARGDIAADTLDRLTDGATYDYVKFDIEGAESAAFEGGAALLARARCIAVAAYHLPGDLVELPRKLRSVLGDAHDWKRAFRHYSQSFDDSIYYFYRS